MASFQVSDLGAALTEGLAGSICRTATAPIDPETFARTMQDELYRTLESRLEPLRANPKVPLARARRFAGKAGGGAGPPIHNIRLWERNGLAPGFTVAMRHNRSNLTQVRITGRVTTPWAPAAGTLVGAALEVLWLLSFAPHFLHWPTAFMAVFIAGVCATTALLFAVFLQFRPIHTGLRRWSSSSASSRPSAYPSSGDSSWASP